MLCGFPPFYEENNAALFAAIKVVLSFGHNCTLVGDVSHNTRCELLYTQAARFDYPPQFWDQVKDDDAAVSVLWLPTSTPNLKMFVRLCGRFPTKRNTSSTDC